MKFLVYSLTSSFLFLFGWCEEADDCSAIPSPFDVKIYAELIDESKDKTRCKNGYAVDFWKIHCPGGPGTTMSYLFKGCYDYDNTTYVSREGIGTWTISFTHAEEQLAIRLVEDNGSELYVTNISAKNISATTDQGSNGLTLQFILSELGTGFSY